MDESECGSLNVGKDVAGKGLDLPTLPPGHRFRVCTSSYTQQSQTLTHLAYTQNKTTVSHAVKAMVPDRHDVAALLSVPHVMKCTKQSKH